MKWWATMIGTAVLAGCGLNPEFVRGQQEGMSVAQLERVAQNSPIEVQRQLAREELANRRNEAIDSGQVRGRFEGDVRAEKVRIGMNADEVRASWGRPRDINRTVTTHGTREQWVYGQFPGPQQYVYLSDGKVTTISEN